MSYKKIIEANKEYNKLYEDYNKILEEKRSLLIEENNKYVKELDLDNLSYTELKELLSLLRYNIDESLKKSINEAYLLKKPYEHKSIEQMDFLSAKSKMILDTKLSKFKGNYLTHTFWYNISSNLEDREKIINLLIDEKIIKVHYKLICSLCGNYMTLLKDEDLEIINEFEILKKTVKEFEMLSDDIDSLDDEKKNLCYKYYDMEESNETPFYQYCSECDKEHEFNSSKELFDFAKEVYFVNK